ncbi:MAG: alpha/beta fold hydrolase [Candidatus Rokubacteria bacterium]|nr:alpha/beta fold hydrolase [Candidatus Rokubacteria bacterium]
MPYATSQGVRVHYRVHGEGPALVLQHGFTWNLESWSRYGYVEALRPHYRLILVDARGHGASDKPHDAAAYALSLRVADVVAVLDALDIRTAHFWGYSMGGWIGFGLAKYAPERVRGLIVGGAHPYERRFPPSALLDGSDPKAFVEALLGRLGVDFATLSAERQAEFFDNDFLALAAAQGDRPSMEDTLPTMRMPCFLYSGEADGVLPDMQRCVQRIPHATFVSFPSLNHPEAFYRADVVLPPVMTFLQSVALWRHASAAHSGG